MITRKNLNYISLLESAYKKAEEALKRNKRIPDPKNLSPEEKQSLEFIASHSEGNKGVLTVLITSLAHKSLKPKQDIRKHQSNIPGGYSGRSIDTKFITPFMQKIGFPAMAESGWLTRSLEQDRPYGLNYHGKITPKELKKAFLDLIDRVQTKGSDPADYLIFLFQLLVLLREEQDIKISKSRYQSKLPIKKLIKLIGMHFNHKYSVSGAARLPVLAVYSAYQCMMGEIERFEGKNLLPLEKHTSADKRSGMPGDIVVREGEHFFEGAEVKHGIKLTAQLTEYIYSKFKKYPISRFYLLSTAGIKAGEESEIDAVIEKVAKEHGCQLIANGVIDSLKYYLRLMKNTDLFLKKYISNVLRDGALKTEHKKQLKIILKQFV